MGPPRRRRRPRLPPYRRGRGRPRRRARTRPPARLQRAPAAADPLRRGRRRAACPRPRPASPVGAAPDRVHRRLPRRGRSGRRLRQRAPVQRHDPLASTPARRPSCAAARDVRPSCARGDRAEARLPPALRRGVDDRVSSACGRCPGSRRWRLRLPPRRSPSTTAARSSSCGPEMVRSGAGSGSTTSAIWPSRSPAAGACSTSTPTQSPIEEQLGRDRCSARCSRTARAAGPLQRRRLRARRPRRDRPAGLGQGGEDRRRPHGRALRGAARQPGRAVTHRFPTAATLAEADPAELPMPRCPIGGAPAPRGTGRRRESSTSAPGPTVTAAGEVLLSVPGIGPWTASYVGMRAFGDPDAYLSGDVGLRNALERLGHPATGAAEERLAEAWRPWRSYAVVHLWRSLEDAPASATRSGRSRSRSRPRSGRPRASSSARAVAARP